MTTVVYKDGYMACDGRVTCSNFIHSDTCNKITKVEGRGWYGWSGDEAQAELFFDILKQEAPTKPITEIDFRDYLEIRLIHVDLEDKVSYISVEDGRAVLFSPTEAYEDIYWEYWNKDCLGEGDTPLEAYNNWLDKNEKLIERYNNENS